MLFLDENCFCDSACADYEVDGFEGYEIGLQDAEPAVFSFGECDEAVFDFIDDAQEYFYERDPGWGNEPLELGDGVTYQEEDHGQGVETAEKGVYGTGIEAQRLRAVNLKTPGVALYKKAVEEMVGRILKPRLQELADAYRDQYNISIGRDGRRGLWSLWAFFKQQFPDPAAFVAFLS